MELSLNRRVFQALLLWCLCVVLLLLLQLTVVLFWTYFGTRGGGFERFAYLTPAYRLGETFFAEQMSLGNVPRGLGLLLLVVILYACLGGTIVCQVCSISSAFSHRQE